MFGSYHPYPTAVGTVSFSAPAAAKLATCCTGLEIRKSQNLEKKRELLEKIAKLQNSINSDEIGGLEKQKMVSNIEVNISTLQRDQKTEDCSERKAARVSTWRRLKRVTGCVFRWGNDRSSNSQRWAWKDCKRRKIWSKCRRLELGSWNHVLTPGLGGEQVTEPQKVRNKGKYCIAHRYVAAAWAVLTSPILRAL